MHAIYYDKCVYFVQTFCRPLLHQPSPKAPQWVFFITPPINPVQILTNLSSHYSPKSTNLPSHSILKSPQAFSLIPAPNPQAFSLTPAPNPIKPSCSLHPQIPSNLPSHPRPKSLEAFLLSTALKPQCPDPSDIQCHSITPTPKLYSPVQSLQIQNPIVLYTFQPTTLVQYPYQYMLLPQPLIPIVMLHLPSPKPHNPIPITPPHPIYLHNPAPLPQPQIPTIFLHHSKASQFMSTTQLQIPTILLHQPEVPTTINLASSPQPNPQPTKAHNCT